MFSMWVWSNRYAYCDKHYPVMFNFFAFLSVYIPVHIFHALLYRYV